MAITVMLRVKTKGRKRKGHYLHQEDLGEVSTALTTNQLFPCFAGRLRELIDRFRSETRRVSYHFSVQADKATLTTIHIDQHALEQELQRTAS